MKMKTLMSVLLAMSMLSACSHVREQAELAPVARAGEVLRVDQPLTIPANTTRVYFQDATATDSRGITVWEHHCALFITHSRHAPHRIEPGTRFVVADLQRKMDMGVWERGVINYRTLLYFTPDSEPVQGMECEYWKHGYDHEAFIDRAQWRAVLGDTITPVTTE